MHVFYAVLYIYIYEYTAFSIEEGVFVLVFINNTILYILSDG